MTPNDLQRAALVLFAARQAEGRGIQEMRAICYVIRNRVRAGWSEGNWLDVLEMADTASAHDPIAQPKPLSISDRSLQTLARQVDEIYFGSDEHSELAEAIGKSLFWCFIDRPIRYEFESRIIKDPENHRNRSQVGFMMLFE